jgi:hypothetical protein
VDGIRLVKMEGELPSRTAMDWEEVMNRQARTRQMSDMALCQQGYFDETGPRRKSSRSPYLSEGLQLIVQPVQRSSGPGCRGAIDVHGQSPSEG